MWLLCKITAVKVLCGWLFISSLYFVLSAAAKKAACSHPETSGDKGEGEEGEKEGVNGEVDEESNGKVKEGEGVACGSKLRACRRAGASEASGPGKELGVFIKYILSVKNMILKWVFFYVKMDEVIFLLTKCFSLEQGKSCALKLPQ